MLIDVNILCTEDVFFNPITSCHAMSTFRGCLYMSPANRTSPGNLLKENLILAMKDHRNDIGKFS